MGGAFDESFWDGGFYPLFGLGDMDWPYDVVKSAMELAPVDVLLSRGLIATSSRL